MGYRRHERWPLAFFPSFFFPSLSCLLLSSCKLIFWLGTHCSLGLPKQREQELQPPLRWNEFLITLVYSFLPRESQQLPSPRRRPSCRREINESCGVNRVASAGLFSPSLRAAKLRSSQLAKLVRFVLVHPTTQLPC